MSTLPSIEESGATPTVLLADDHVRILESVQKLLGSAYQVVACVENGRLALDKAVELLPDLVVLDIDMPEMDGIRAAQEMRRLGLKARILFLSVHFEEEYIEAARKCGDGYIVKSRMATDLHLAIHEAVVGRFFLSEHIKGHGGP